MGELLGGALVWFYFAGGGQQRADTAAAHIAETTARYTQSETPLSDVMADIRASLPSWNVDAIKDELARTGKVARRKANVLGDVVSDTAITTRVKAKLVRDSELSGWSISVHTTDGVVSLSGKVVSAEQVIRAMQLAMATEGVVEVVSSLQIVNDDRR